MLKALGDPERLAVVAQLTEGPQDIGECFKDNPNVPKSTRSHLMKVLREAGLVTSQKRGTWVWYRAVPERLGALRDALAPTR